MVLAAHGTAVGDDCAPWAGGRHRPPRLSPLLPVNLGDHSPDYIRWTDTASFTCILQIVEDHQVRRLPVIDNHRLVGIITEADLARNLDEHRLAEFVEKVYATT